MRTPFPDKVQGMGDEEARKEVWKGKVAVCFTLDESEVDHSFGKEHPEPVYVMLSRISYFPLIYDKLNRQFQHSISSSEDDQLWLEYQGKPLKWHYPVGVYYDLTSPSSVQLWKITVHYKNFPSDVILQYTRKEIVEAHFKSRVKEFQFIAPYHPYKDGHGISNEMHHQLQPKKTKADCLKHRKEIIQMLKPQEFEQLWTAYLNENYDDFWTINNKLMANARGELEPFKNIPFVLYEDDQFPIQRLMPSVHSGGGAEVTLRGLLQQYCPHIFSRTSHHVVIHGVQPSLDTSLQWLSRHFSYPDNFLHIVVLTT